MMPPIDDLPGPRISRRELLRSLGSGVGAAWLLAACGRGGEPGPLDPKEIYNAPQAGRVRVANWPLSIDKARDAEGVRYSPSLREFTERTDIEVDHREVIQDYPSFLGRLEPQFREGEPTGWDVVMVGARDAAFLSEHGWLLPLDPAKRPNFERNAAPWARDPTFDPGNAYTMAWQGGLTGIAVNRDLALGEVATLGDLADPSKVGTDSVGMITQEMGDFVMVNLGIDPATSGPEEWREAADWLVMQRDSGTVHAYYDQAYIADLTQENLTASMAWSGDILYYGVWTGREELGFVLPEAGGLRWVDNAAIPVDAEHPVDALIFIDFFYDLEIASMVTEWTLLMSPVAGVQERVRERAEEAIDEGARIYGNKLLRTAESPLAFPDAGMLASTSFLRDLRSQEEREEWDAIFLSIPLG